MQKIVTPLAWSISSSRSQRVVERMAAGPRRESLPRTQGHGSLLPTIEFSGTAILHLLPPELGTLAPLDHLTRRDVGDRDAGLTCARDPAHDASQDALRMGYEGLLLPYADTIDADWHVLGAAWLWR